MTKQQFISTYYPFARKASEQNGIPVLFALAQSALESGWGKSAPRNMLFGIKVGSGKDFGGWSGDKQLITTTEYASTPSASFPVILDGYPVQHSSGRWKYRIKDYFRAYPSPLNSFLDWGGLLSKAARYREAMRQKNDPYRFAEEVAAAGYATSPTYAEKVKSIMRDIEGLIPSPQKTGTKKTSRTRRLLPLILLATGSLLLLTAMLR
ncbi:MAG: glucosaminidase domain-containing protein [Bacteroidota bacterium]